jgi:hypothetical protein
MGYSFSDKVRMFICKVFGHFPRDEWVYNGVHANCKCCKKIVTWEDEEWV